MMLNGADVQAGLDRTKRPCVHCGKVMRRPNLSTHEPACAPEAREARRVRSMLHAREVRGRPGWKRPAEKRDFCPECGAAKNVTSARCKGCDKGGPREVPAITRFWSKVDRRGPDECWPWLGARGPLGYGAFRGDDGNIGAHRFALETVLGPLGPGMETRHDCDNPPCCNPSHLRPGTHAENMADMARRGRSAGNRKRAVA